MQITPHKFITPKTARVFTSGNAKDPKNIWILCHGYGNTAETFLQRFACLDPFKNFLIAPEGLHRFYRHGSSGKVGASWMTKEERQDDIDDYLKWLSTVYKNFVPAGTKARIILLGFSQGGATVSRFLEKAGFPVDFLVLYATTFPQDVVPYGNFARYISNKIFFVLGKKDEFIDKEEGQKQIAILQSFGKTVDIIEFNGTHVIDEEVMRGIQDELDYFVKK